MVLHGHVPCFYGIDPHLSVNHFPETKVGVPSLQCLVEDDERYFIKQNFLANKDTDQQRKKSKPSSNIEHDTNFPPSPAK